MPGRHNILNSLGACTLALELGIPFDTITQALKTFKGVERRFSYRGLFQGAEIFDDYGHHPKEIASTLAVAKQRAKKSLTVIFQPHRYTRTHKLWDDFVQTFMATNIDHLVITDIYAASETPIKNIDSKKLVESIKKLNPLFSVTYLPYDEHFTHLKQHIRQHIGQDDLLLLLGAGKLNKLACQLTE
jgi:UDP-N-acetylmuramate--alanine ligase